MKKFLATLALLGGCALPSYEEYRSPIDDGCSLELITHPRSGMEHVAQVPIVRLNGSDYERGYQYGLLLRPVLRKVYEERNDAIHWLFLREHPYSFGFNFFVPDLYFRSCFSDAAPFVPRAFRARLRGMADASGVPLAEIQELVGAVMVLDSSCSGFAAWGSATSDGRLIQTRNLDISPEDLLLRHYPVIEVHHPEQGHQYLAIGILGVPGAISGINSQGISVTEVGAQAADKTFEGVPMPALLEQVLNQAGTLDEAASIISKSRPTGGYVFIVGSANERRAIRVDRTGSMTVFYDDQGRLALGDTGLVPAGDVSVPWFERIDDVVLAADPFLDESARKRQLAARGREGELVFPSGRSFRVRYARHARLVREKYGSIDQLVAREISAQVTPSSNVHSIVYDFDRGRVYFSNAALGGGMDARAAVQPFIELDLGEIFSGQ